ncbi:hypothetical protein M0R36_08150 [bacterium]|jgi:RNA recognition motif-containing protein|nr:hypothetical protein [bacterium]
MKKIIKKMRLEDKKDDLAYWLSKTPEERIEAVEILRKQFNGSAARLQRTVRVIKQA